LKLAAFAKAFLRSPPFAPAGKELAYLDHALSCCEVLSAFGIVAFFEKICFTETCPQFWNGLPLMGFRLFSGHFCFSCEKLLKALQWSQDSSKSDAQMLCWMSTKLRNLRQTRNRLRITHLADAMTGA
jgi:hypothetical protein